MATHICPGFIDELSEDTVNRAALFTMHRDSRLVVGSHCKECKIEDCPSLELWRMQYPGRLSYSIQFARISEAFHGED